MRSGSADGAPTRKRAAQRVNEKRATRFERWCRVLATRCSIAALARRTVNAARFPSRAHLPAICGGSVVVEPLFFGKGTA
jgi:hypothetical protein